MIELTLLVSVCIFLAASSFAIVIFISRGITLLYTPLLLFITFHLIFVLAGAVLFCVDHRILSHVLISKNLYASQFQYAFDMGIAAFFTAIGGLFCSIVFRFKPKFEIARFQLQEINTKWFKEVKFISVILLSLSFSIAFYYLFHVVGNIPLISALINLLGGQDSGLSQARAAAVTPGWVVQIIRSIIPALVLVVVLSRRICSSGRLFFMLNCLFIFAAVFLLLANGERMPLIMFLVSWFVASNYVMSLKNNLWKTVAFVVLFFLILGTFTVLLGRIPGGKFDIAGLGEIIKGILHRIFISQSQTGSYIYQLYYEGKSHVNFDIYIQNLMTYLPNNINSFSVDLFYLVHGRKGSASHSSFAESYASFGSLGVVLISSLLGFLLQSLTIFLVRGDKSILRMVIYVFVGISFSMSALGSITGIFYNGLIATVFLYAFVFFMASLLRIYVVKFKRYT